MRTITEEYPEEDNEENYEEESFHTYKDNILVYMAGYVQRRIVSKETCDECLNIVKGCQTTSQFLNLRDSGGLVRPNVDIPKVVKLTDNVIVIRDRLAKLLTDRDVFKKINVEVFMRISQVCCKKLTSRILPTK